MTTDAFGIASVEGTFGTAIIGHRGNSAFASVGLLSFDGRGGVSGSLTENRPAARFGDRTLVTVPYRGTYTVNENGIGTTAVPENGEQNSLFSIRRTDNIDGSRIAQELAMVFLPLDVSSGSLKTAVATRLPDGAIFGNGSLKGRYVGASISHGGQAIAAGFGALRYDGNGGFSEANMANVQGSTFRDRQIITGSDHGTYAVNPDGTGTVAGGGVVFVITRARLADSVALAEEYAFVVRDPVPATGILFTGVTKRLSD